MTKKKTTKRKASRRVMKQSKSKDFGLQLNSEEKVPDLVKACELIDAQILRYEGTAYGIKISLDRIATLNVDKAVKEEACQPVCDLLSKLQEIIFKLTKLNDVNEGNQNKLNTLV